MNVVYREFILLITLAAALAAPSAYALELPDDFDDLVRRALETAALTPADIRLKTDHAPRDVFRLDVAEQLLAEPLTIPAWTEAIAERTARATRLGELMDLAASTKDLDTTATSFTPNTREGWTLYDALRVLARAEGTTLTLRRKDLAGQLERVPPPVRKALTLLVEACTAARLSAAEAYTGLSDEDRVFLIANISRITTEGESLGPDETDRVFELIKQVDQQKLAEAAKILCVATDTARRLLASHAAELAAWGTQNAVTAPTRLGTPLGDIVVGTCNDDVYREPAFILIDPAGDDVYLNRTGASSLTLNGIGIGLDLSGNDHYIAHESFAFGAAKCGFGILVDEAGDDAYSGTHNCLGRGVLGLGLLVEAGGLDRYSADTASQAAAHFGFGILLDEAGNDKYTAHLNSQAHAGVNGAAFLIDTEGNDFYIAGAKYKDYREGQKYYGSLSQGFSIGWRPLYSGGIGALFDYAGNDTYIGDYFAQGSSYWYSVGLLYDDAGDDRYVARRYSQGAATHVCVGVLADSAGDDRYESWGVSQGCGHDLSAGMLIDGAGNDRYTANWLSQGAGNANGIGFLIDLRGDDRYTGEKDTVQAAGTFARKETTYARARGYPSIGILIDAAGKDAYSHGGRDGTFWHNSAFGAGFDAAPEQKTH